jgi:hypothetical protein
MKKRAGVKFGMIGGGIIALFYVILLWIKFNFLSYNPFVFYLGNFVSYLLIIASLAILGFQYRLKLGGYAEIKDVFQPIFIAVIFSELAYLLFSYYYFNHVAPDFFVHYEKAMLEFATAQKMPDEKIAAQVKMVQDQAVSSKDFWVLFKGVFLRWIVVDSIFGIIIAFLLRKRTPQQLMDRAMGKQQFN